MIESRTVISSPRSASRRAFEFDFGDVAATFSKIHISCPETDVARRPLGIGDGPIGPPGDRQLLSTFNVFVLIHPVTPTFSGIANQSIPLGTATATFSGTLADGAQTPQGENVAVTLDGATQQAVIGPLGAFSTTFSTASLAVPRSPYPISYVYKGDGLFSGASATSTLTVTKVAPTVSVADTGGTYNDTSFPATAGVSGLNSSDASSLEGVAPTLAYYSGTDPLDSATLLPAAPIEAGTYTVRASFAGSTDYESATALVNFTITQATPQVTWVAPASIVFGTPLGLSQLDALSNVAGTPVFNPAAGAFLDAGNFQTLSVTFAPLDPVDYTSVTKTTTIGVEKATPTFSVTDSGGRFDGRPYPASVTIAGAGSDNSPAASLEGITPALTYNTSAGIRLGSTPPTATGNFTVVASFTGSSNYSPVQSAPVPFTIAQGNATIVLTSSMGSAVHGQSVTFVATVAAAASGTPSGSVTFSDGGTPLATVALGGSGIAMLSTSSLALGTHSITAAYSGDSSFLGAQSTPTTKSVFQAATQVILVPQPVFNKKKKLVSVGLIAEIQPLSPGAGVPTGEVTFEMVKTVKKKKTKTTILGTVAASGGDATLTLKASQVLNKTITIVYSGDSDFQSSTATTLALTQSGLKGLARPMIALVNRGRLDLDASRATAAGRGLGNL